MTSDHLEPIGLPPLWRAVRQQTPARIFLPDSGLSYSTETLLQLRQDHAWAVDAVREEVDLVRDFGADLIERFQLFEVQLVL